LLQQLQNSLRT